MSSPPSSLAKKFSSSLARGLGTVLSCRNSNGLIAQVTREMRTAIISLFSDMTQMFFRVI